MAIIYNTQHRTMTLHTGRTTYQMQIDPNGHLLHLYYGARVPDTSLAYLYVLTDCGFSPNSYESRYRRDISLDILPQEYSSCNTGDYRLPALDLSADNGAWGTDLRYVSHDILPGKYHLPGLPASFGSESEAETLSVLLKDEATGTEVTLLYGVFEDADMITRAAMIRNAGSRTIRLEKASSLCLDVPFGQWDLLHFHGRHCMERMPERQRLIHGIQTVSSRRGASSHHQNPFVVLMDHAATETSGVCLGAMLAYSGSHRTDIELDQTGLVRIVSGINEDTFAWELAPGETFSAPEVLLCWTDQGLGDISHHYHRFLLNHMIRSKLVNRCPILINTWEAMMFDFTAERLMHFAQDAAELGIGMLVLDDGWFGNRNSDNSGLGDWTVNTSKLPGGLLEIANGVHALGMKFGLWIEPEMVNEDSDLYRAHPDWALSVPGRKPSMGRNQLVLDMGRREGVDALFEMLSTLISQNGIDYIKWDMNRNMTDIYSHALPEERQPEASHRYILGVYDLMDRLTTAFPEVLFEGCAGGGGRFDAGMLYYTPQIWCSDDTDAIERLTIQMGTSVGYPIATVGAHVSICPNQQTGRTVPFGTRALTAMSGTFGYELDPAHLTEEEKSQVKGQIERFKKLRELIGTGRYHRLSDFNCEQDVVAWEFSKEDGSQALLNLVVTHPRANGHGSHVKLRGLCSDAVYRIAEAVFEGRQIVLESTSLSETLLEDRRFSGASLMQAGFTLPPLLGDYPSVQLLFERVDEVLECVR